MEEIQQATEVKDEFQPTVEVRQDNQKGRKKRGLLWQENIIGWIYVAPMLIGLFVFTAIPLIMSILAMFYQWDGITGLFESEFVGFDHFAAIFGGIHSAVYWKAFGNTLIFALQLPIGMIVGMFLALAMNRPMRGVQIFRIIYYLPCVMSIVAVTIIWQNLFAFDGSINNMLGTSIDWLVSDAGIAVTVILLQVWKGVGYTALMFIAGLQSVSTDQLEAAKIDGANAWTILIKITLPALYPIVFYLFVTGLMGAMQMFNEPFILVEYGINNNAMTSVSFVYWCFGNSNLGLASVAAWILAFIIIVITVIQMYVDKRKQEAE
ncbi:MAG: sugar ABC transporter permease [Clostridiales bacterium]|nr:sugar ABC transporter permease [Clostridiales bacterium]